MRKRWVSVKKDKKGGFLNRYDFAMQGEIL